MSDESQRIAGPGGTGPGREDRRGLLARLLALGGAAAALVVPTVAGVVAFLNPLRQKGEAGGLLRIAPLAALPEDGTPRKFTVIADRTDAWNRFPQEPVGAVFLRRIGPDRVAAWQAVCPHAGCTIRYETSREGGKFFCPCHAASFSLDGVRTDATSPSPRDMDALEAEVRDPSEVWVKFQNFATGTSRKIAQA